MYFSKVVSKSNLIPRESNWRAYEDHKIVWRFIAGNESQERDFLFRREMKPNGTPAFYLVSHRKPEDSSGLWEINTKEYSPVINDGEVLSFSVRVNPIVSKSTDGKAHRHDVVMNRKKELAAMGEALSEYEIVTSACQDWISTRQDKYGFLVHLDSLMAQSYQQHRFKKKAGSQVQFSTVDLSGLLQVKNPDKFLETLYTGMGPAKGFGCGLLLVKRANLAFGNSSLG